MPILTEKNVQSILCELKKKIEGSIGVVSAIRQGSVGFENWVQIEMSGILDEYINNGNNILIENIVDICICGNNDNVPEAVIEIKTIKNSERRMHEIQEAVERLNIFEPNNTAMERAFFCVLYKSVQMEITCEQTLGEISHYIGARPLQVIVQEGFNVGDNNGGNIQVFLYLNRWGGIPPELQ